LKPIDFVTALAQLLSQPELQTRFAKNPDQVANQLNIADDHRALFLALSPEQVIAQATLLITKRRKEVRKYLPHTITSLGKDFEACFQSYATAHWPHSYRRHPEDAYQFCEYLKSHRYSVNQSEFNRLVFLKSGHRFRLTWANDALIKGHHSSAIQFFYRYKGASGQWRLYLKA
jgi:hypothetical protein